MDAERLGQRDPSQEFCMINLSGTEELRPILTLTRVASVCAELEEDRRWRVMHEKRLLRSRRWENARKQVGVHRIASHLVCFAARCEQAMRDGKKANNKSNE